MKIQIPLDEMSALIKAKSGHEIQFTAQGKKTIKVNYDLNVKMPIVGNVSKNISADFTIKGLEGEKLHLSYSSNMLGLKSILPSLFKMFPSINKDNLVAFTDDSDLVVDLSKIDKVHKVLEQVEIEDITFSDTSMEVLFSMKLSEQLRK